MVKIAKIELYIVDINDEGIDDLLFSMCNDVVAIIIEGKKEIKDIGEWNDDNPLNFSDTMLEEVRRIFKG